MRNFGPKLKPVKDMAVGGNKWARVISKAIDEAVNKGNPKVKPECKEHIGNEEACHAIDKMIEWYYQVEEPEFLKFYNCHLEMLERHGDN